jgi:hypothetical protein
VLVCGVIEVQGQQEGDLHKTWVQEMLGMHEVMQKMNKLRVLSGKGKSR